MRSHRLVGAILRGQNHQPCHLRDPQPDPAIAMETVTAMTIAKPPAPWALDAGARAPVLPDIVAAQPSVSPAQ